MMLYSMRSAFLAAAGWLMLMACVADLHAASEPRVTNLSGQVQQLVPKGARVVVLIFAATDCPISNRYIPEITQLEREFAGSGVMFWWVFPNPGDTAAVIRKHEMEFSLHMPTLVDARQELVRMAHVGVTPEAAVFAVDGAKLREVYHGRIDDRYIAFGQQRPAATRHELADAVKALLADKPVAAATGGPVGCAIVPAVATQGVPLQP
ncbi:redoxin domain-containing protein [Acidicapsa ligni]|uniref:redoxin domain-containing protein n=1 Tax=Acidicapsa ligni TaxID=542300 RepID=UPI0021E0A4E2|nr:redoxin domain-containing protein [Acidicapsa ligni]